MRTDSRTTDRTRHRAALKSAAEGRQAIAAARRLHLGQVRAAVRTQIEESYRRRLELSGALGRLRRGLTEFRAQLRTRLRERPPAAAAAPPPAAAVTPPETARAVDAPVRTAPANDTREKRTNATAG